ncbi:phosphoglycerate mutase [[Bacillus] enclensis]|uniref:2,3-bisphosphoglycerate-dependent phosphoglycerate mutase n=1 Tax=[Bacillus] enclensis TaxID=1402860 RepID=A0A0V8HH42_9BACI|nr:histidine phosphatase family protein [[Bacillus] enclensis]KSU62043.1 phosphoglycerate mutase [[Bacillus] enclensis]SCB98305.1 2,3-bisphosphoglycerate-dependent phosphoglycerate mutase [[Bacillus] enclensis]
MPTTIYFVRHSHSVYTPEELERPLSERGKRDAARVRGILKDKNLHAVCSSPYKRAIETVEGTASFFNKKIDIYEDLKERQLSGEPVEDFSQAILKVWKEPEFSFPGGESNREAQKRGIQDFLEILERYEGKNVAIGTHGNIMVLIMNHFDPQYDIEFWQKLEMPDIYKLTFEGKSLLGVERVLD